MKDARHIFICGLHRSGTSLLHKCLRSHHEISGFTGTGVPQDEGQHLQSVYPTTRALGCPGKFGFDPESHMDENHPLATSESAERLLLEWSHHWDLSKRYLVEKSPPNIVRTRFLQKLFPDSCFVVIFRHPVAVAKATQKWSKTSSMSLLEHSLLCYESFKRDFSFLRRVCLLRYEELVQEPEDEIGRILDWLQIARHHREIAINPGINEKYYHDWENEGIIYPVVDGVDSRVVYEKRLNQFGYSLGEEKVLAWDTKGWGSVTKRSFGSLWDKRKDHGSGPSSPIGSHPRTREGAWPCDQPNH